MPSRCVSVIWICCSRKRKRLPLPGFAGRAGDGRRKTDLLAEVVNPARLRTGLEDHARGRPLGKGLAEFTESVIVPSPLGRHTSGWFPAFASGLAYWLEFARGQYTPPGTRARE